MASISPTFLSGYLGSVTVDGVALPVTQWSGTHEVNVNDFTNSTSGGAQNVERGIEKLTGSFTVVWKVVSGAPQFSVGSKYAATLVTQGTQKYAANALIKSVAAKTDIKGIVSYDCNYESDGAITPPTN